MNIEHVENFVSAAGWTLTHFLWQGTLVGLLLGTVLRMTKARYLASTCAMLLLLAIAVTTFAVHWNGNASSSLALSSLPLIVPANESVEHEKVSSVRDRQPVAVFPEEAVANLNNAVPAGASSSDKAPAIGVPLSIDEFNTEHVATGWQWWVVALWLCGVSVCGTRLWLDWRAVRSLHRTAQALPNDSVWVEKFTILAERVRISRPVRLMLSPKISTPAAFGVLKPVVIVPLAMLSSLSPEQVESILLHELAHVRRHDYLVNLFQSVMESVFFFHPVVWWISSHIKLEREHCCDDIAASCSGVSQYARALAALEQLRSTATFRLATAADGGNRGNLLNRIRRLSRRDAPDRLGLAWVLPLMGVVMCALITVTWMGLPTIAGGESTDWNTLHVSHYSNDSREVFCVHTEDAIHAVVVIKVPEKWTSQNSAAGVKRKGKSSHFLAWANFRWNKSPLVIRFDSENPNRLRLNNRSFGLTRGRVIYWSAGGTTEQSMNLTSKLPAMADNPRRKPDDEVAKVRQRIIDEFSSQSGRVTVARLQGTWSLSGGVQLKIQHSPLNGPNQATYAVLHWPDDKDGPARYCRFDIAEDVFGNFEPWAVAWESGTTELWVVTGQRSLDHTRNGKPIATKLSRVDFHDSDHIVERRYDGCPQTNGPVAAVLEGLDKQITIQPVTEEKIRYHYTSVPGEQSPPGWFYNPLDIHAVEDKEGTFRVGPDQAECTPVNLTAIRESKTRSWREWIESQNETMQKAVAPIARATIIAPADTKNEEIDRIIEACREAGLWGTATRNSQLDLSTTKEAPTVNEPDEDEPEVESVDHHVTVFGTVVDNETGQLIEQGVTVQMGMFDTKKSSPTVSWGYGYSTGGGPDGRFSTVVNWQRGRRARVLVDGYEPHPMLAKAPKLGLKRVEVTLRLKRTKAISGHVLNHEGIAVAGASVFAARLVPLNLRRGMAWQSGGRQDHAARPVTTDKDGRFEGLRLGEDRRVVVSSPELDAWPMVVGEGVQEIDVRLPEPSTVVINYDIPGAPEDVDVYYQYLTANGKQWKRVGPDRGFTIKRGRTELPALPPGYYQIFRQRLADMGPVGRYAVMGRRYFQVKPGATHTIEWTRPNGGAVVIAKLLWSKDVPLRGLMYSFAGDPVKDLGGLNSPNLMDGGPVDLKVGKIQSAVLPPGTYTLSIIGQLPVSKERQRYSTPILPDFSTSIEVTIPEGSTEVDLGEITLAIRDRTVN